MRWCVENRERGEREREKERVVGEMMLKSNMDDDKTHVRIFFCLCLHFLLADLILI